MNASLEPRPEWTKQALQGVAYWIGHRRCMYRNYPLSEGALVAEICNLIHANLPDQLVLLCEMRYSEIVAGADKLPKLMKNARADLVVAEEYVGTKGRRKPKFIVEVKTSSGGFRTNR